MRTGLVEITDLLWPVDAAGVGLSVWRDAAIDALVSRGQRRAARIVAKMPHVGGVIDEDYLRRLAVRIHSELQRLGEELQIDRRMAALLTPKLDELVAASKTTVTVLDVGCGIGHVARSAVAHGYLPAAVEVVGVDLNGILVEEATRLAATEALDCRFVHGDAFDIGRVDVDPARTVVVSSGMLHHLTEFELGGFFAAQSDAGFAGFAHWDIAPCLWSTAGAWVFHQARMREPVSRHDGVMSARRAHRAEILLAAANEGAPEYAASVLEGPRWYPRALDVLRPIVGYR